MRGTCKGLGRLAAVLAVLGTAYGCSSGGGGGDTPSLASTNPDAPPVFHAEGFPARLSAWNLISVTGGELRLAKGALPYDLATPLFSDYASKLRVVWLPAGQGAAYHPTESFAFPVGTIIAKTFYYPRGGGAAGRVALAPDTTEDRLAQGFDLAAVRLVETRLLVRRAAGWIALPYVWNADQSDAVLKRTGAIETLTMEEPGGALRPVTYVVPNANQCQECHATNATTRAILPIGLKTRHLNKDFAYADGSENQLARWARTGALEGLSDRPQALPRSALWGDEKASLDARARTYLDINCAHCHNPAGAADTSGLDLEAGRSFGLATGSCKSPIAAGTGTGNRSFVIVPGHPDKSILSFRMASTKPSEMMPELGRSLAHREGVALIDAWIAGLAGDCR